MADRISLPYFSEIPEWAVKQSDKWMPVIEAEYSTGSNFYWSIKEAFKGKGNPYWLALELVTSTSDWKVPRFNKSPTLAVAIMRAFMNLAQERTFAPAPSRISICAFAITFLNVSNELFDLILKAYNLKDFTGLCEPVIRQALELNAQPIESVARAVHLLDMLNYFSARQLLFPLYAQSPTKRLYDLLSTSKGKQREFVSFLDSLLVEKLEPGLAEQVELFRAYKIGKTALNRGNLKGTVLRLAKKYKLNGEVCPNATRMQLCSTLAYLLREIYVDGIVPKDDCLDMVCDFVGNQHHLQQQALRFMMAPKFNDFTTAAACARLWRLNTAQMPTGLVEAIAVNKQQLFLECSRPQTNAANENYYELKLSDSTIIFVDDQAKFDKFLCKAMGEYGMQVGIIGIDCEWRPVFEPGVKPRLALLQVATKFSVHIFDMIALKTVLLPHHWTSLVETVFCHRKTVKLGFSMNGDTGILSNFDPAFCRLRSDWVNMLDMSDVCQKFYKEKPEVYPYHDVNNPAGKGLTDYVKLCFGLFLDKGEQMSNWERRPLRRSQLRYAALDAFCLLEIHDVINKGCSMLDLDFGDFIKGPTLKDKTSGKKEQTTRGKFRSKVGRKWN